MGKYKEPGTPIKYRFSDILNPELSIVAGRIKDYGLHPMCEACLTRKTGKCQNPQYNAFGLLKFECTDVK